MKNTMILDNFEEYADPILYDKENESLNDIPLLLKWASQLKGTIIDLACGTGRATIPLASKGHNLIGVDFHNKMLEKAKKKASSLNLQIQWIQQDCTKLDLNIKSNFIYSVGNSFQHFLTNEAQDELLSSVNKHLETGGIFIFDTRFPSIEELLQPSEKEYWKSYIDSDTKNKVDIYTISNYDSLTQLQHYITIRKYKNQYGKVIDEKRTKISLRYTFPKEMERLLLSHGLDILNIYSDWNESHIKSDSYQMIYICKKTK